MIAKKRDFKKCRERKPSMNSMRFVVTSLLLVSLFSVNAEANSSSLSVGRPNAVLIKIDSTNSVKCNIEVTLPWQEKFELEIDPPAMEAKFEITPRERGPLTIKWNGKTKFRGLRSVPSCVGSGEVTLVAAYTSETAKPLWDRFFSTLSAEQADCVKVGMDVSNLRSTSIDLNAEVVDPDDNRVRSVFSRCVSFFKTRQGFLDKGWSDENLFPCVLRGVKTSCEGGYAERLQDGKLRRVSKIEAFRLHFENKAWTVSQREPDAMRDSRSRQGGQASAEEERQRELKRNADEKAATAGVGASSVGTTPSTNSTPLPESKVQVKGDLVPNLSIATGLPRSPGRPSGAYYEMMSIEGKDQYNDRVKIQIFSDGQASVIARKSADFFMHKGNGVFSNGDKTVLVDEKNRRVRIGELVVNEVNIVRKHREKPLEQMTYGEKLHFPAPLNQAKSETELKAACAAVASKFGRRTDWADKAALRDAIFWAGCLDMSEVANREYRSSRSKWEGLLNNINASSLVVYYDRCTKDYLVTTVSTVNKSTGLIERRCFQVMSDH